MGRKKKVILSEPEKLSESIVSQITAVNFIISENLRDVSLLRNSKKNCTTEEDARNWNMKFLDHTKRIDSANKILKDILGIRDVIDKLVEDTVNELNPRLREYDELKASVLKFKAELVELRKMKIQFMAVKRKIESGEYVKRSK